MNKQYILSQQEYEAIKHHILQIGQINHRKYTDPSYPVTFDDAATIADHYRCLCMLLDL